MLREPTCVFRGARRGSKGTFWEDWKDGRVEDRKTGKLGKAPVVSLQEGEWKDGRWENCLNCDSFDLGITLIVGV